MKRTANRPLPAGRMTRQTALHFGVGLSAFSVILMGLVVGLSMNLKVSGPVYLLPALVLLQARTGRWSWVAIAAIASVIALVSPSRNCAS